jgi:hypothetical protein
MLMNESKQSQPKQPWSPPEIVPVGAVLDATQGANQNVAEPATNPPTYSYNKTIEPGAEVDLGDK